MQWSDVVNLHMPFEAEILPSVLRHVKGEEWMVGKRCTIVEVYRADNSPNVLCELDYGLDIGIKLISLPLDHVRPTKPVTKVRLTDVEPKTKPKPHVNKAKATGLTPDDLEL